MKPIIQNMISMIIPMKTKVAFWFWGLLHMSPSATYSPIPHTTVHVTNTKARNQIGLPSVLLSMMLEREREREREISLLLVYERQRCFRKTWLFYTVEYHIYKWSRIWKVKSLSWFVKTVGPLQFYYLGLTKPADHRFVLNIYDLIAKLECVN